MKDIKSPHFNKTPRRKAEFIKPPNTLKDKVGFGGLSADILKKAQKLIDNNKYDYRPQGEMTLEAMLLAIHDARQTIISKDKKKHEASIAAVLFPAMQLKINAGMFHYPLVTLIADKQVQFLEVIEKIGEPELEVIEGFYTTLRAIFVAQMKGDGGEKGKKLYNAMLGACKRYFDKYGSKLN